MNTTCRAAGCLREAASRYSVYCAHHKARLRRHGDIHQDGISAAELRPHVRRVEARIKKNPDSPAWTHLDRRWLDVVDHAKRVVGQFEAGRAGLGFELRAAHAVIRIADESKPRQIVITVLAIFAMQALEPRRFKSDAGFRFQLVRRVRSLSDMTAGLAYDHTLGKTRRVYRELPPKAVVVIGQWLADALGVGGMRVGELELDDEQRQATEREELFKALGDLR